MRKYILSLFVAGLFVVPVFAFADHTQSHTVEQLRAQIAALQAQINALSQQQTQAPPAASSALQNNDSVRATTILKIRSIAGLSGTAIAKASAGATGVIWCNLVSGGACPTTTNGLRWWYVDWDDASLPNGWSAEATSEGSFLVKNAIAAIVNAPGVATSSVVTQPSITVLSPNGGEVWRAGETREIKFKIAGDGQVGYASIAVFREVPIVFEDRFNNQKLFAGEYKSLWKIPEDISPGEHRVQAVLYKTPAGIGMPAVPALDYSDASFNIVSSSTPGGIDFTVENVHIPNGGVGEEVVLEFNIINRGGETFYWSKYGRGVQYTVDYLNPANGYNTKERLISDGCNTSVNLVPGSGCSVKIGLIFNDPGEKKILITADYTNLVSETNENNNTETGFVSISSAPSITVLSPNGGETLKIGKSFDIVWSVNALSLDFSFIQVSLHKLDGSGYSISNPLPVGSRIFRWTIPNNQEVGQYKIEVHAFDGSGALARIRGDSSDAPFSIVPDTSAPIQISTAGQISQKLHYAQSSNSFYGIGSDNAVWKWDDSSKQWSRITDGSIKDDFHFISESDIYGIGLDNQIWRWNGIRWNQVSEGGKIQHKIWHVDGNHIYGIGMDNQVWRWGSAGGWVQITSNGKIKDDFHFISESDIYGIGLDGQIWRWNGSAWNQISSGGVIKQKLHFMNPTEIYGIGADNRIWGWSNGVWSPLHDSGQAKDDFVIVGGNAAVYAIGLDNQIWKLPPRRLGQIPSAKTFSSLPQESSVVRTNPEQQLANILVSIQAQLNEIAEKIKSLFDGLRR